MVESQKNTANTSTASIVRVKKNLMNSAKSLTVSTKPARSILIK